MEVELSTEKRVFEPEYQYLLWYTRLLWAWEYFSTSINRDLYAPLKVYNTIWAIYKQRVLFSSTVPSSTRSCHNRGHSFCRRWKHRTLAKESYPTRRSSSRCWHFRTSPRAWKCFVKIPARLRGNWRKRLVKTTHYTCKTTTMKLHWDIWNLRCHTQYHSQLRR